MTNNEAILFEQLRSGDEAAFKSIYIKYVSRLYYFVREYVKRNDLTENIVQDTLMALWNKKQSLTNDTNISAYLFTVAKNNCLYRLRELKNQHKIYCNNGDFLELTANYDALSVLDTSVLTFSEIENIIKKTLEQLPPQCRKVFEKSRFEEKKNREIANELNISIKAVESHISKALKIFRTNLKEYLPLVIFLF